MTIAPHYQDDRVTLHHGDCLQVLRSDELGYDYRHGYAPPLIPDNSVDSVVTDPPYGLEFMGKEWDRFGKDTGSGYREKPRITTRPDAVSAYSSTGNQGVNSFQAGRPFQRWCEEWSAECLRVLKPGGHMLAFGGTRTFHRLTCAVEDAGFEIRDSIAWLYGSGFPKSLDVSKAIDKRRDWTALPRLQAKVREARTALGISQSEAARRCGIIGPDESLGGGGFMWFETGMRVPTREQYPRLKAALGLDDECDQAFEEAEREILSSTTTSRTDDGSWASDVASGMFRSGERTVDLTAPATPDAERWQGWGTALKPAFEPIVVARKPLTGTVAGNVLTHGTGALNIDGCRIGGEDDMNGWHRDARDEHAVTRGRDGEASADRRYTDQGGTNFAALPGVRGGNPAGRWPANVVLDESQAAELDQQSGTLTSGANPTRRGVDGDRTAYGEFAGQADANPKRGVDVGGASRFFYTAKAATTERVRLNGTAHPTVKPLALMRWLARLITPPGGTVLEPFTGSGTTVEACILEGLRCIAIEREGEYLPLIVQRVHRRLDPVSAVLSQGGDAGLFDLLDMGGTPS